MTRTIALLALAFTLGAPATAAEYVQAPGSSLTFASRYQGEVFTGRFPSFTTRLRFDPKQLATSNLDVAIPLAGVTTRNSDRDSTLQSADFFNTAKYPQARFTSSRFRSLGGNRYAADGTLALRGLAEQMRQRLSGIPGLVDLTVEKQVLIPQIMVRLDPQRLAQTGLAPGEAIRVLQALTDGAHGAQLVDGNKRYELVLRLPDDRRSPQDLARTLIDTPAGRIPVSSIATVEETDGPNQIGRENGRRRIVVYANTDGGDMGRVIADIRRIIEGTTLPSGNFISLEGQFQAQEQATRLIAGLSVVSLVMIFLVLYSRYQSVVLAGIVMANIPLALIGSVMAMWIAGVQLSVASMVGFITLAGIATRNGILKISHYINLCKFEGETFSQAMIVRGSLERLTPVLMTALVAAFALTPLLLAADAPGKEILHPVAVVIFGGLVSSTLLDTLLTPVMYWMFGRESTERLLGEDAQTPAVADAREAF